MQESKGVEIQAEIEKDVELCSTSYYYEDYIHFEEIREHARQIEKSIQAKEPRFLHRVLRSLPTTRKILTNTILKRIIHSFYTHSVKDRDFLLSYLEQVPGDDLVQQRMQSIKSSTSPLLPEVDVYFHLLLLLRLLDTGKHKEAADLSDALMQKVISQNRRSLDTLAARCYFYYQRSFELIGQMDKARSFLLTRLRTSTLRNDFDGQATLTNCLLRNYLHYNLYDQADKLASKAAFPESANNNEWSRYLYYIGRIKAIQLQYSLAYKNLQQAVQRAPQSTALGFKQIVQKMIIVVELLMGKIPERSVFRQKNMRRSLAPYFQLTLAIRFGDVQKFEEVVTLFAKKFRADNTYTLILRLRHNAIKTAIRYISLSYIKISLKDIAQKLMLDSIEEAEFVVAKAIRDGVIDAFIDEDGKFMQSREISDVYSTREPQISFHQRVQFCLDVHNQSIKAMRFPPKSCNKSYIKDSAGMDESSRITILEALAKTLSVELDHRRAGEDKLKVLELTDRSYGVHLAEISIDPLVRLPLRQLSSIVLRDYTNKHWSIFCGNFVPPKPSEESKVTIRRLLVIGLQEPDTKVKNAIAYALANVVKWDWPHDCPDLLDILLKYIRTENPDLVDGSMRVLLELAGVISDMQIPILGPIILQEVYKVFTDVQKYRLRIREMALDLFLTLYERICEVVFTNKSLVIPLLENILLQFSQALVMALQANDGPALDNHLRAKIFQVWTSIVLVSPKEVLTSLEEIMPTVISFLKSILNATDAKLSEEDVGASNDDGAGHPGMPLLAVLDFLYALVDTPHLRHFVRAAIEDVLYYLLICMQIPNSQVEIFLENVDLFIINEDSFDFKELVRNRAQVVLKDICKEFAAFEAPTAFGNAVMRLLEQATRYKNEGRHDWWKCLEVSMQSIGLVAHIYVGPSVFGKMGDQLVTFNPVTVVQSIFDDPMIRDAPPFLLGECIWAAGQLADILPEDLKRRVIKASVEALHLNQHHVMKVCGIRTIYDLCQHLEDRKQIAEILPYLPTLMNTLVGIANQYPEGEFLHLVLEVFPRLMVLDQAFTAASAPNFLPFLRDVFAAKTEDRTIIARIEEIIKKLVKIPEVLANIQTIPFPALVQLLQVRSSTNGNLKAGLGNVFRMLKIIVRASTSPLGEELLQPLPLVLRVLDETIHTLGENGKTLNITTIKVIKEFLVQCF
ncbi:importin-9-like isoform X2 [Artemia franciscana]|uniref:importin-9-like isoform X2 n=1 Tax=Artemia franciscana TaxID=6661 RepID=UPI0032DB2D2F